MCKRGEPLCIIYNSRLQGKTTKLKKTEAVAYIQVWNIPPPFLLDHKTEPTKSTQRQGCTKGNRGKDHERVHLFLSVFLWEPSRCDIIWVYGLFQCRYPSRSFPVQRWPSSIWPLTGGCIESPWSVPGTRPQCCWPQSCSPYILSLLCLRKVLHSASHMTQYQKATNTSTKLNSSWDYEETR